MSERLVENIKRLEFETVQSHDRISIATGIGDERWKYDFAVTEKPNLWPVGTLTAINPQGQESDSIPFELHGCGRWTTRRQNPVQTQERAFTSYYKGLIVGDFLWGRVPIESDRMVFDKPGQEISEILHTPYRENAILGTLQGEIGALSVRQITEIIQEHGEQALPEADIRLTLRKLATQGYVSLVQKKVQVFELMNR